MRRLEQFALSRPRAAYALAGAAVVAAFVLILVHENPLNLIVLQDHPIRPMAVWPPVALLIIAAGSLAIPRGRRSSRAAVVAMVATGVLFCGGAATLDGTVFIVGRGSDLVGHAYAADGRYEVRVFHSPVIAENGDEWDVVVQRRDGLRFVPGYAGCLYSAVSRYRGIQSIEAGRTRLTTDHGVVDIRFDPATMRVTTPIPSDLCGGYG